LYVKIQSSRWVSLSERTARTHERAHMHTNTHTHMHTNTHTHTHTHTHMYRAKFN